MLRELVKDEKVLVYTHDGEGGNPFPIGTIVTFEKMGGCNLPICDGRTVRRHKFIAIGDEVVRGPDMDKDCNCGHVKEGLVGEVIRFRDEGRNVTIRWDGRGYDSFYRMTPDHQDLKPTGDSEAEDGKPGDSDWEEDFDPCDDCPSSITAKECNGGSCRNNGSSDVNCPKETTCKTCRKDCIRNETHKMQGVNVTCVIYDEPKPIKEDSTMSRSERKRELRETVIPHKKDAKAEAALSLTQAENELERLDAHDTDHAEIIADIIKAKDVTSEEAEAILRLSKGVGIQV